MKIEEEPGYKENEREKNDNEEKYNKRGEYDGKFTSTKAILEPTNEATQRDYLKKYKSSKQLPPIESS